MNQMKPHPLFRLMPSLTDLAFLLPLVFLFIRMDGLSTLMGDGDTGFHIRAGDWIIKNGRVPDIDIFSYTMPTQPWYAWEWLWDVGASLVHSRWGLNGITIANLFLICLTFALLYRLISIRCGNPIFSIGLTVLATIGSTIHWLARPHLVTLLMTVVFMLILQKVREGNLRLLWWLPFITILWTNLHAGFIVGIVILGIYGTGFLLQAAVAANPVDRMAQAKASLPYFAAAAGCLAASLVNPYFYQLHVHIVKYFADPYSMNNIDEFQSPNFHQGISHYLEAALILGVASAVWFAVRRRFVDALLILVWAHGALIAVRNVPIFVLIATPIVGSALVAWGRSLEGAPVASWVSRLVGWFEEAGSELVPIEGIRRLHVISAAAFVLIFFGTGSAGAGAKLQAKYDPANYPEKALAKLDATQHVFTNDEWGDYLIYRLSPTGFKVFVDGRSDFYGEKFGMAFIDVLNVKFDWEAKLRRYGVDTILLPVATPLTGAVKESKNWRVVYDDGVAIIFRPAAWSAVQGQQISTGVVGGTSVGEANRKGHNGNVTRPRPIFRDGRIFQTTRGGQNI